MSEEAPTLSAPAYFRVGDFLIRPTLKAIRPFHGFDAPSSAEKDRRLPDKAIAVLMKLAEEPRKVFSREQLLDEVWGQEREAYDRVLDNAISELRRAFGDNAREPRYIETITKQGYRLIAPVEWPGRLGADDFVPPDEEFVDLNGPIDAVTDAVTKTVPGPEPESPHQSVESLRPGGGQDASARGTQSDIGRSLAGGDRRLYALFAFLALVLVGAIVVELLRRGSVAQIVIQRMPNSTQNPSYGDLEEKILARLEVESCANSRIALRGIAFLADTSIAGRVDRDAEKISLYATVAGGDHEAQPIKVEALIGADPDRLIEVFADRIQEVLDRSLCESGRHPARACHCTRAAERLWREQRYGEAERYIERSAIAAPADLDLLDLTIDLNLKRGEFEPAQEKLDQALKILGESDPQNRVWSVRLERRQAQLDRDFSAELAALNALRMAQPEEPRWALELGRYHLSARRDCEGSQAAFDDAQINGGLEGRLPSLARKQAICGELDLARSRLRAYLEHYPESASALTLEAEVLRLSGDYKEARLNLSRALRLVADFPPALLERAKGRLDQGHFARSAEDFAHYQRAAPWPRGLHQGAIGRALVALQAGDSRGALEQAQAADEALPGSAEVAWALGWAAALEERFDDGYQQAELIKQLGEEQVTKQYLVLYHHLLGVLASAQGDWAAAVDAFYDAVAQRPREAAFFRLALARAFIDAGRVDRAEERLDEILAENNHYAPALCLQGSINERQGDEDEARRLYRRAFLSWSDQPQDQAMKKCRQSLRELETSVDP